MRRRMRCSGLLFAALLTLVAHPAFPQAFTCTSTNCTLPTGSYHFPVDKTVQQSTNLTADVLASEIDVEIPGSSRSDASGLTFALTGANGASSSSGNAGGGAVSGNLIFNQSSTFGIKLTADPTFTFQTWVPGLRVRTQGGNGGNYTNSNNNFDGGTGANAGTVTINNNSAIDINTSGGTLVGPGGVGILAESRGGAGGSGNQGKQGGVGFEATVINNGEVTIDGAQATTGFWGVAARSLGGNGGGSQQSGAAGNNSRAATVTNNDGVTVNLQWSAAAVTSPADAPVGVYGLYAASIAGNGSNSGADNQPGGNAGSAGPANVTSTNLFSSVTVSVSKQSGATLGSGAALGAFSIGGNGGQGRDNSTAGTGGAAGVVTAAVGNSDVRTTGDQVDGIRAVSQGGIGGSGRLDEKLSVGNRGGHSENGSSSTDPVVTVTVSNHGTVLTNGVRSAGIVAGSFGGAGGAGGDYTVAGSVEDAGIGGSGGHSGPVLVQLQDSGTRLETKGEQSPAIVATARGGNGGKGGAKTGSVGSSGDGGAGGTGAGVTVTVGSGTDVTTAGGAGTDGTTASFGVLASSIGGDGAAGGRLSVLVNGGRAGNGGAGGAGGDVLVRQDGDIRTTGAQAVAVVGRSIGGAGGVAGEIDLGGGTSDAGTGGRSGNSGNVTIINDGSVTTAGSAAHGLVGQATSGTSGSGGSENAIFYGSGGSAGASGIVGTVDITNSGRIQTSGSASVGIEAQAIGGGSGSGGQTSGGFVELGGSAGFAASGGTVIVTNQDSINTSGNYGLGILAQSIGGGGGNGGDGSGVVSSVGGSGTGGGAGGSATVNLSAGHVTTTGTLAHATVVQSIGGGGGNGGDATAASGLLTVTIGGSAGAGGAGGPATVNGTGGTISTSGTKSAGIVAQSVGGGGGTGGAAYARTASLGVAAAVAVGGTGGNGGVPGATTVSLANTTISTGLSTVANSNTNPVDAFGIVAQSIGGGGGLGGSAVANAVAISIPIPATGVSYSGSMSAAIGGAAGDGGGSSNQSTVTVALSPGTTVTTQGQGSHGAMVQSIGGGGGSGGDSSAMSATVDYGRAASAAGISTWDMDVSVAVGGAAASGGIGGPVSFTMGSSSGQSEQARIVTYGDFANGALLQSIGGGGGNGGVGSTTTQSFGSNRNLSLTLNLGGSGGSGQNGGIVTATLNPNASIRTYGAGAIGLAAQSIGGGGGASQGGTVSLGASYALGNGATVTPGFEGRFNWGGTGAGGGNGALVTVNMNGAITTAGGDAIGVLAQSIGGGGGTSGSAGADASSDNPVSTLTGLRTAITNASTLNLNLPVEFSATLGGRGGVAGVGGPVTVNLSGSVVTAGDWAAGVVGQSVGGGGGKGGTAASSSSGLLPAINLSIGGASSASGGDGGQVTMSLQNAMVCTGRTQDCASPSGKGYAALGILAQSIGGGGGLASDGSNDATGRITIGGSRASTSGIGGNGNTISLSGSGTIVTSGNAAPAVVLQSIGGGGGVGGSGNSASTSSSAITLRVGGSLPGATGSGRSVTVDNALLNIATSGYSSYGILAQSIGGGGGLGITPMTGTTALTLIGTSSGNTGAGGLVTVTTAAGSTITTSGIGSHGILAQSIGGGGGVSTFLPSSTPALNDQFLPAGINAGIAEGSSDAVRVNANGTIIATGRGAFGILAQSIGNGGGIGVIGGTLFASPMGLPGDFDPTSAGPVSVTQSGSIIASGENGVGIFAQSAAIVRSNVITTVGSPIDISINGSVRGGSGTQGRGVWVSVGSNGTPGNTLVINSGGSVGAASNDAIYQSPGGSLFVTNFGTVTGNYTLGSFGTFSNAGGGTLVTGATADAKATTNAGRVLIGPRGSFSRTSFAGDLVQTATGTLILDADFTNRRSSIATVAGDASLSGQIVPVVTSVLPDVALPVVTATGTLSGDVSGKSSTLFGYGVQHAGQQLLLMATSADFTPPGFALQGNRMAVAEHLQAIWDAGGAPSLGPLFATLGNSADAGGAAAYSADLRQLSPYATFAPGARGTANAQSFANGALSCPTFEGTTAMLIEGQCGWTRVTGRSTNQSGGAGTPDLHVDAVTWQIGGQTELAPGWFLGGSLAYETSWLSSSDKLETGSGQAGYGAVTLKYQTGPWLFSAAAFGGAGQFNTSRVIALPGFESVAKGNPDTANVGMLVRAAYTLGREEFYLRPSLTLGTIHVQTGAYREGGAGALNLAVNSASQTNVLLSPMLEVGGRVALGNNMLLRPYVAVGMGFQSNAAWTSTARLAAAPAGASGFTTSMPIGQTVGRVSAGAQLYGGGPIALRVQYDGEFSGIVSSHAGSFVASVRF